jgi:hypothetical protein
VEVVEPSLSFRIALIFFCISFICFTLISGSGFSLLSLATYHHRKRQILLHRLCFRVVAVSKLMVRMTLAIEFALVAGDILLNILTNDEILAQRKVYKDR